MFFETFAMFSSASKLLATSLVKHERIFRSPLSWIVTTPVSFLVAREG